MASFPLHGSRSSTWMAMPVPQSTDSLQKAMSRTADCRCSTASESVCIEIGGAHDGRHSTTANRRSSLTFLAPAPTFQPNRERLVCDDTDVRLISRHSSAPFVEVPRRSPASHLVHMAPGLPQARRFDLSLSVPLPRRSPKATRTD